MAATFEFEEDNGASSGTAPATKGTIRTAARTEVNWKNIDDSTSAYSAYPVQAGNNSFTKYQFCHWSGVYNQISSVLFAHISGSFPTGVSLKGAVLGSYATPAVASNSNLTIDMTTAIAIASGAAVQVTNVASATGPESQNFAASTSQNPAFSQWFATQIQTTTSAPAGDTASQTLGVQYNEN